MMRRRALAPFVLIALTGLAQAQMPGREIPARTIPVPDTVSPEMQAVIAAPLSNWDVHPKTAQEWKDMVAQGEARTRTLLPKLREQLGVTLSPAELGGVKTFILMPRDVASENRNRVFLHFHGGGYVRNPGEGGTREAAIMAAFGRAKVISVDYRLAPDDPYPAALDDAVAAYRALIKTVPPRNIAVFGTSTGGGLTMALILRAKAEGLPLPGAIGLGSPWVDITKTGDTFFTNAFVDNFQVTYDGWLVAKPPGSMPTVTIPRTRCCRRSMATCTAFRPRSSPRARAICC